MLIKYMMLSVSAVRKVACFLGVVLCAFFFYTPATFAGACIPDSGSPSIGNVDISQFVTSPSDDYVGYTKTFDMSSSIAPATATCGCASGPSSDFWDWASFLVATESVGGITYGILDEYVGIAVMPRTDANVWAPYSDLDYSNGGTVCGQNNIGGGAGKAQLRIRKKIIGTVFVGSVMFYQKGTNTYRGEGARVPETQINFYGTINVPQNCVLDTGDIIDIDLGNIWSGKFDTKGQKAKDYPPVVRTVAVRCSGGISANANLTVRFQATSDANVRDAIASDNRDVGVMIADKNGNVITPNTGVIPFSLDNYQATYTFQVYPVSTTGNQPREGKFTALAYMRIDFA